MVHRIHTAVAAKPAGIGWAFVVFGADGRAVHGDCGVAESVETTSAEVETVVRAVTWAVETNRSATIYTSYVPLTTTTPEPLRSMLQRVQQNHQISIALRINQGRADVVGASAAHRAAEAALDRFLRTNDSSRARWEFPLNKVRRIPAA